MASVVWLCLAEAAYVAMLLAGDLRKRPLLLMAALAMASCAWLALAVAIRKGTLGRPPRHLLLASIAFRLTLLPAAPSLSDDVYRYLWDGKVLLATGNPYRHAPADPALASLRDAEWARINYKEIPTIYPPAAQILFAAANLVPWRLFATKVLLMACEGALVAALYRLLRGRTDLLLLYLLHPLPIVEIYASAHVEPLGVAALLWTAVLLERHRPQGAAIALGIGILAKLFPIALVPRALGTIRGRGALMLALVLALAYAPFLGAGAHLVHGAGEYGTRWRWYDTGFTLILGSVRAVHGGEAFKSGLIWLDAATYGTRWRDPVRAFYPYANDQGVARALTLVLFAAVLAACTWRRLSFTATAATAAAAMMILTPSLHPWYALWLVPWLSLHFSWGAAVLSLFPLGSYATFVHGEAAAGAWKEPLLVKWTSIAVVATAGVLSRLEWSHGQGDEERKEDAGEARAQRAAQG